MTDQAVLVELDLGLRWARQRDRVRVAVTAERCDGLGLATMNAQQRAVELFDPGQMRTPDEDTNPVVVAAGRVTFLDVAQGRPAPRR